MITLTSVRYCPKLDDKDNFYCVFLQFLFKHVDGVSKAMIIDLDAHQVSFKSLVLRLNNWQVF